MQSEPVVLVMVLRERAGCAAARMVEAGEEERSCRAARRRGVGDGRILTGLQFVKFLDDGQ